MTSPKNFCISLTSFGVSQFSTSFIFSSFILISSGLITTSKNPTFLFTFFQFYIQVVLYQPLYYLLYYFIMLLLFFHFHNYVIDKRISLKSITIGLSDSSRVINIAFHLSFFFICIVLNYPLLIIFITISRS